MVAKFLFRSQQMSEKSLGLCAWLFYAWLRHSLSREIADEKIFFKNLVAGGLRIFLHNTLKSVVLTFSLR